MDRDNAPEDVERPKLQSLAQAARGKSLHSARNVLLIIGVLTILLNVYLLIQTPNEVRTALNQELGRQGVVANAGERRHAEQFMLLFSYAIYGSTVFLGVVFIVCGLLVSRFPVPVTVLSLVLYILAIIIFAVLDPASLAMGIIFKIIVVVCLVKAIQSAIAYQREQALEASRLAMADEYE